MLVFSFFKNKMANFKQLINERGQKETGNDVSLGYVTNFIVIILFDLDFIFISFLGKL